MKRRGRSRAFNAAASSPVAGPFGSFVFVPSLPMQVAITVARDAVHKVPWDRSAATADPDAIPDAGGACLVHPEDGIGGI